MDRGDEVAMAMARGGVEGELDLGFEWRNCKFREDLRAFLLPLMRENRKVFVHGDTTVLISSPITSTPTPTPTLDYFFFLYNIFFLVSIVCLEFAYLIEAENILLKVL